MHIRKLLLGIAIAMLLVTVAGAQTEAPVLDSIGPKNVNEGVNLRYIQELMGHESLESTKKYIKITIKDLYKALVKFHPREKYMAQKDICFKGDNLSFRT